MDKTKDCQHKNLEYQKCCNNITCKDCDKRWGEKEIIQVPIYVDRYVSQPFFPKTPVIPYYEVIC